MDNRFSTSVSKKVVITVNMNHRIHITWVVLFTTLLELVSGHFIWIPDSIGHKKTRMANDIFYCSSRLVTYTSIAGHCRWSHLRVIFTRVMQIRQIIVWRVQSVYLYSNQIYQINKRDWLESEPHKVPSEFLERPSRRTTRLCCKGLFCFHVNHMHNI